MNVCMYVCTVHVRCTCTGTNGTVPGVPGIWYLFEFYKNLYVLHVQVPMVRIYLYLCTTTCSTTCTVLRLNLNTFKKECTQLGFV
jgi:hypothetical protein